MAGGTVYGVVLNDQAQIAAMAPVFAEPPYNAPPKAPVVYIKPRNCLTQGGAPVILPHDLKVVEAAATVALLFGETRSTPAAAALALDVCEPHDSFYRPAVRQRGRDGFLPMGAFARYALDTLVQGELETIVDGVAVHRWPLRRLLRSIPELIGDLQTFMSLLPGDVLLVGLPGDAPHIRAGQSVSVAHPGLPTLFTRCFAEAVA